MPGPFELPDGAAQVFAEVTRISPLDPNGSGSVPVGAGCMVTDQLLKATFTPTMETGVDLVQINANADIATAYKHGDMPKYYTMAIEMNTPDPITHNLLAGGTILTDNSLALGAVGTLTATPGSAGTLPAGTYAYRVTAANQYGETLPSTEVTATTTGTTGSVALSLATPPAGAKYFRWYGRTAGAEQFLAQTTTASYTDDGSAVPAGALPTVDTSAGPGNVGAQAAPMFVPGNHRGVSMEFWAAAVVKGAQTVYLPYWRWVVPAVTDLHVEPREFGPTIQANSYTGIARENPGWGAGPFGDWQFDSSRAYQYARAAITTVPKAGLSTIPATA